MAWSRRARRRVLLIVMILVVLTGGVIGAREVLQWQRARAFEQARNEGMAAFARGDHPASLATLGPLISRNPNDLEVVRAVAISRLNIEEEDDSHLPRAVVLFQRVVELDPQDLEARRELLRIYPRLGFMRESLDMADVILEANPDDPEALEARVQILMALGRWAEAADISARLVQQNPDSSRWKQLQISTALASGLEPSEAVELTKSWPRGRFDDGLDELVVAALLALKGESEESSRIANLGVARGAANGARLENMLSILSDLGLASEAERLIRDFAERIGVEDEVFTRIAAGWGFASGRSDFLIDLVEGSTDAGAARAELVAPLALLSIDLDPKTRGRWLRELEQSSPGRSEASRSRAAILAASDVVRSRDRKVFAELRSAAEAQNSTVMEKIAAARAALSIGDVVLTNRLAEAAESQERTFLGSLVLMEGKAQLGNMPEAIDHVLESIVRYPGRLEFALALVIMWCDGRPLPADLEERIVETTGDSDPLKLAERIVEAGGINAATAIPLAAAAIDQRRPDILDDVVVAMLAADPPQTTVMLNLRRRIEPLSPVLAERLLARLREASPEDPRVIAISVGTSGSDEERLRSLRDALPLDASEPSVRREAWLTLVGETQGMDGSLFRRVANEAVQEFPGDVVLLNRILFDQRTWEDRDLTRRVIDLGKQLRGEDSVEHMLAEANWLLTFDRDNGPARIEAIAKLNTELLSNPASYSIGATLLRLMIADSATDPQSAIRLGRRLLADRPDAIELYPIVIDLMQSQGSIADADRLLREFEAIDRDGLVSSRQRALSSFRQGNLEELVRDLSRVTDRSGRGNDSLALGRERAAVGDLAGAEQAYRAAMTDDAVKAEAVLRLGLVLQRMGRTEESKSMLSAVGGELSQLQTSLALAEIRVAEGDAKGAAADLQQAAATLGGDPLYWRGLAVTKIAAGDRGGAVDAAVEGLRLDPQSEDLLSIAISVAFEEPSVIDRAAATMASGTTPAVLQESIRILRSARNESGRLSPDPDDLRMAKELCSRFGDAQAAWRLATGLHQAAGRSSEALALASAAARRFPDSPDPLQWQVFAASSLGDLDKASAMCAEWRRLRFPDVRPVDEAQAALELARNRPEAALVLLSRHRDLIAAEASTRPGPYRALLASMIMSGQVREAARMEQANLAGSEASAATWAEIASMAPYESGLEAMAILEANTPAEAGQRSRMIGRWLSFHARHPDGRGLERARSLLPRNLSVSSDYESRIFTVALADVERSSGEFEKANRNLRSVIESFPSNTQERAKTIGALSGQQQQQLFREIEPLLYARNNLAMLLVEQDTDLEDALSLVRDCLEILPGSPELRDTEAQVLLRLGRLSEAEQSSVFAIRSLPLSTPVLLTGAEILLASGRVEDSKLLVQRIREILAREPWPSQEVEDRLRRVGMNIESSQ